MTKPMSQFLSGSNPWCAECREGDGRPMSASTEKSFVIRGGGGGNVMDCSNSPRRSTGGGNSGPCEIT